MEHRQTERENENVNRGLMRSDISVMRNVIRCLSSSLNALDNGSGLKCASLSHHPIQIGS